MAQEITSAMTLNGNTDPPGFRLIAALIQGGINGVPSAHMEFSARNKALDLGDLVGTDMGFWVEDEDGKRQPFWGTCISAEAKGTQHGEGIYIAEIRPWLWFLTRTRNNRIFQELKTTEIVKEILGEYGFSGDLKVKHSNTDTTRDYCVQYRESDLDFIKRLLEEEGFYFYFEHGDGKVTMILADQPSTHQASSDVTTYVYSEANEGAGREQINVWDAVEKAVTGKVTLRDYDFTKPSSDLTTTSVLQSGSHGHKGYESYAYPGRYRDVKDGDKRANALIEEEAAGHQTWTALGTMLNVNAGSLFEIADHPRHEQGKENGFLVTDIAQFLNLHGDTLTGGSNLLREAERWGGVAKGLLDHIAAATGEAGAQAAEAGSAMFSQMQTMINAVLKGKPYRGPGITPRPIISGVQTAVVTGASGDEIMVDEYGRIKVQFHWDREGNKDDKTTCWVRTMMPWTGKNWGMVGLPRVGQEVVIQFEEGDPDRPICIGMLYNAETMPPYELPADATMTGIKTNSSKGGGGYNELMFEDKAGDELIRFMAQKDYVQNVINQAHIKIGYPHGDDIRKAEAQDDQSLMVEVENHYDEIVERGDHSMTISDGNQVLHVEKDKTETINGESQLEVTKDKIVSVTQGNWNQTVDTGNISIDATAGKIDISAAQSITLTCGANSITIDQAGITLDGINISNSAQAEFKATSNAMAEVKTMGMMTISGSIVNIN